MYHHHIHYHRHHVDASGFITNTELERFVKDLYSDNGQLVAMFMNSIPKKNEITLDDFSTFVKTHQGLLVPGMVYIYMYIYRYIYRYVM
jgi:hypothetical protein